ncbi:hypothetical protein C8R47DRAFT_1321520 [Mycena vitilis]|nr:hypothetical protein C8R47DRAFT_1321520 [Mycena vitilis]
MASSGRTRSVYSHRSARSYQQTPHHPSPKAVPGDVCAVDNTSLELPFMAMIVAAMKKMRMKTPRSQRSSQVESHRDRISASNAESRLDTLTNNPWGKSHRPCVILPARRHMEGEGEPGDAGKICLMGTFEGADPDTLPSMYRDFVVPVYPNPGLDPSIPSVQSTPSWVCEKSQWIIALPMEPKAGLSEDLPQWSSKDMNRGAKFDKEALKVITVLCYKKNKEWERRSSQRSFVREAYQEIRDSKKRKHAARDTTELDHQPRSRSQSLYSPSSSPFTVKLFGIRPSNSLVTREIILAPKAGPARTLASESEWPELPSIRPPALTTITESEEADSMMMRLKTLALKPSFSSLRRSLHSPRSVKSLRVPSVRAIPPPQPITEEPRLDNWRVKVDCRLR